jgi:outer membrane lipase/esterase
MFSRFSSLFQSAGLLRSVIIAVFAGYASMLSAQSFSSVQRMVVFGDRLSDTGRVGGEAEANNTIWVEELAMELGLPFPLPYDASTQSDARNFAQLGATALGGSPFDDGDEQLDLYLVDELEGASIPANTLIVLGFGLNDLLQGASPSDVANAVGDMLERLADAGAELVILPNLLPLGHTPSKNSDVTTWNLVATHFNSALEANLATLAFSKPELEVVLVDVYSLIEDAVLNPSEYGLTDVTSASDFTAADPLTSLWWSLVSPTSLGHSFIADAAYTRLLTVLPGDASNVSLSIVVTTSGNRRLLVKGPALEILRIERSSDLSAWSDHTTFVDFDGEETIDLFAPSSVPLYYRAR